MEVMQEAKRELEREQETQDAGVCFANLPQKSFSVSPYTGNLVMLVRGDCVLYGTGASELNAVEAAADNNARRGITPAQASAMLAGALHGWSDPRANPADYAEDGTYIGKGDL